jgi:hypothetical protein
MTRDKIQQLAILAGSNSIFMSANTVFMERFAGLVLEEAAKQAESRLHAGEAGPAIIVKAIRAMKPEVK